MRAEDLTELGDVYTDEEDFEEAYHMYLEAAIAGDADACTRLAQMYLHGNEFVRQDYAKCFHFLKMDYERSGRIRCEMVLAELDVLYDETANNAFRDYIEFMIDNGEWEFYIVKGSNMIEGGPYPPDAQAEMRCYEEAWKHEIIMGREMIAEMYYSGRGVEQDYKKAYDLWQSYEGSASTAKDYYLGEMYLYGRYVEQDSDVAKEYFQKIINMGKEWEVDDYYQEAEKRLEEMGL